MFKNVPESQETLNLDCYNTQLKYILTDTHVQVISLPSVACSIQLKMVVNSHKYRPVGEKQPKQRLGESAVL